MTDLSKYRRVIAVSFSRLDFMREIPMNEFAIELGRRMKARGVTRADLARRLGTSQAYVTKVLGGTTNFTIETMAKLAMALDGTLHLHISDSHVTTRWADDDQEANSAFSTTYSLPHSTDVDARLYDDHHVEAARETFVWLS